MSEELAEWQKRIIDLTDSDEMEMIEEGKIDFDYLKQTDNESTTRNMYKLLKKD